MGETNIMDGFRVTIVVMLFYSLCITVVTYAMPPDAQDFISMFSDKTSEFSQENIGEEVQSGLTQQTNIPIIEAGALVFYSGNFLIDLLLNFVYAIPEMIGYITAAIIYLFNADPVMIAYIQGFAFVLMTVLYFVGIIQLLTGIRSGRVV